VCQKHAWAEEKRHAPACFKIGKAVSNMADSTVSDSNGKFFSHRVRSRFADGATRDSSQVICAGTFFGTEMYNRSQISYI